MRTYGTHKILPVYGNYKPVERRRNNTKIAGWIPSTKQGESVEFADTYNDTAEVVIEGNTVQEYFNDDKSLSFDGVDDYVICGVLPDLSGGITTVNILIKAAYSHSKVFIINQPNNIGLGFYTSGANKTLIVKAGYAVPLIDINDWDDNAWNKITLRYSVDRMTVDCFVNGVEKTKLTTTNSWSESNSNLFIGKRSFGNQTLCKIASVDIWDKDFTQAEIQANQFNRLTGQEEGLVGYWYFNEGTGNIAHDIAGSNDGTI